MCFNKAKCTTGMAGVGHTAQSTWYGQAPFPLKLWRTGSTTSESCDGCIRRFEHRVSGAGILELEVTLPQLRILGLPLIRW